jgi:peroxiredoxin
MKLKNSLLTITSALFLCFSQLAYADTTVVGAPAPEFTIKDAHGNPHSLSQYKGKNVVLEWFNPDCPFVKKFYRNGDMAAFQKQVVESGDVWLTINSSAEGRQGHISASDAREAQTKLGLASTALLLDPEGAVGKAYGARTTPHLFVVDANGTLAYAGAIDSIPSTNSDDVSRATNYVTEALAALKAGKKVETSATDPYGCAVKYKG